MITIHMLGGLNVDCHDDQKDKIYLDNTALEVTDTRGKRWSLLVRNIIAVEYR